MRFLDDQALERLRGVCDAPDLAGTRYELRELLGRGGMGAVFRVYDRELERDAALKVLDDLGAAVELDEARLLAKLEHPGIVPVHDAGTLPDGRAYFVMKLVRGARLDAWAKTASLSQLLRAFQKICEAVAFAHNRAIVHRDLKPSNVMVGEFGEVLTLDWGIAQVAHAATDVAGTPRYMAPEQARGEADARSDVYSLGAMLREVLPANPPAPVRSICVKAMSEEPQQRYGGAMELYEDLARFLDRERVTAHPEDAYEKTLRLAGNHRVLVGLVLAYLVMRAVLIVWKFG